MLASYSCDYLHNSGKVCGKACTRSEGCRHHYQAKKRYPCTDCGKPTGSASGRYNLHKRVVKRLGLRLDFDIDTLKVRFLWVRKVVKNRL
ncbi:hypothetical protein Glove_344g28 [Diversispora epigaea]|uniref:C2H2-type domain-containing protein n=1 Tax=Diversispora epigaea TaxID=1348612 RepID=A0A397HGP7_9GLOM|nr:hypothetical protein Glove_344g28 [Diversispora epigaea]